MALKKWMPWAKYCTLPCLLKYFFGGSCLTSCSAGRPTAGAEIKGPSVENPELTDVLCLEPDVG